MSPINGAPVGRQSEGEYEVCLKGRRGRHRILWHFAKFHIAQLNILFLVNGKRMLWPCCFDRPLPVHIWWLGSVRVLTACTHNIV